MSLILRDRNIRRRRSHIHRFLVRVGYRKSPSQIFRRFLHRSRFERNPSVTGNVCLTPGMSFVAHNAAVFLLIPMGIPHGVLGRNTAESQHQRHGRGKVGTVSHLILKKEPVYIVISFGTDYLCRIRVLPEICLNSLGLLVIRLTSFGDLRRKVDYPLSRHGCIRVSRKILCLSRYCIILFLRHNLVEVYIVKQLHILIYGLVIIAWPRFAFQNLHKIRICVIHRHVFQQISEMTALLSAKSLQRFILNRKDMVRHYQVIRPEISVFYIDPSDLREACRFVFIDIIVIECIYILNKPLIERLRLNFLI